MAKESILIIEGDIDLSYITKAQLHRRGYEVSCAANYQMTEELIQKNKFDVVLLDVKLPDCNGMEVCKQLRKKTFCPIILISCISDKETIITALRQGADDYMIKPLDPDILAARITANLRRTKQYWRADRYRLATIYFDDFMIERSKQQVWRIDQHQQIKELIALSPIEFRLLDMFAENQNVLLTYEEIYRCIWETDANEDYRTVMVHISNLRKKISTSKNEVIHTVRRAGYIFQGGQGRL